MFCLESLVTHDTNACVLHCTNPIPNISLATCAFCFLYSQSVHFLIFGTYAYKWTDQPGPESGDTEIHTPKYWDVIWILHNSSNCTTSVEIVKIGRRPFTSCKLNIRVILLMKHTWPIFFQFRLSIRFLLRSILPLNHDSPQNVIYLLGAKTKIIEKSVVIEADVKRNEV